METERRITYEILGVKGLKTLSYFFHIHTYLENY